MGGVMICLVVSCFLWSGELESPYLLLSHHVIPLASHTIIILISIYLSFAIQCVIDHPYAILYLGIVGASIMQGLYISLYLCLHLYIDIYLYIYISIDLNTSFHIPDLVML